jgi:sulfate transport system ATP-binding protein
MNDGKVVQVGTPEDIYDRPVSPFVASFVGGANLLRGEIRDGRPALGGMAAAAPGSPGASEGASAFGFVRPHDVKLSRADGAATASLPEPPFVIDGRTVALARVERLSFLGAHVKVALRLPDGGALSVEMPTAELEALALREGDRVMADLQETRLFVGDYSI